jgi:F0F1-type ATP synthase membrane subunit b/b'
MNATIIIVIVAVAALGLLVWVARRQGVMSERADQVQDDLRAADVVAKKKAEAHQMTDDELEAKGSKWTKRS